MYVMMMSTRHDMKWSNKEKVFCILLGGERKKKIQGDIAGWSGRSWWKIFPDNTPNHTRKYNVFTRKKSFRFSLTLFKKLHQKVTSNAIPSFLSNALVHIIINVYPVCYSWSDMYA